MRFSPRMYHATNAAPPIISAKKMIRGTSTTDAVIART
jgi:hypothetical protein